MKKVILSLASIAMLVACGGEEKKETPAANQTTQNEEVAAPAANAEVVTFNVVNDSSSVLNWKGSAVGKEHFGTVNYTGSLNVSEGKLVGGELVFDMKTIDGKDLEGEWKQKLDGHLMAPDFFNVDSFPTAKLVLKGFDGTNLNGDLTIKDVTKAISFPASVNVSENTLEGSAEFTINRTEYGITYGSGSFFDLAKDKVISDEIVFNVSVKAAK